ncbi:hypothetical protein CR513_04459, partial [Mucuna pruriens]
MDDKESMACREEPTTRGQPSTPITNEAHQHLPTVVVRALSVEVLDKLVDAGALVVRIKLEVNVVYEVTVTLPQGQVVALNLVVVEWGNRGKGDDPVGF